jgi:hypothetical protein
MVGDRYNALIVVLNRDVNEEDAQPTINAIRQIKGVLEVEPHVADVVSRMSEMRARIALQRKIWEVLSGS